VKVVRRSGRKHLVLRWRDPITRKWRERSSECGRQRDAERAAARLALDIEDGLIDQDEMDWIVFRKRYEEEHLPSLKPKSLGSWRTAANGLQRFIQPTAPIQSITADCLSRWQAELRAKGLAEASIRTYLGTIHAALGWAHDVGILDEVPKIRMPARAKGKSKMARARPITVEEFERILMTVPKIRRRDPDRWTYFLRGLWHSGFRVEELLTLSWNAGELLSIDTYEGMPYVRILSEGEKAHTDRIQPITPEFWALCCETPEKRRHGPVFKMPGRHGNQMGVKTVGRMISRIGERAGVITDPSTKKYASSHDIGRRAFTTRMGATLSLPELAAWMRHKTADTTLNYYYEPQAQQLASKVWPAPQEGATLGAKPPEPENDEKEGST